MFGVTENDLCGEHRFKSAMQWCLCVFLPRKTTCYILFNQTRRCDSTSFWLWGGTVSVLPTSICIGFTQRPCTKSAAQDFQAAPKCCCFFSSAAPMPGTSFSQYFLKALLMSSPLTFFITGALPFEFLLYFHILYLRHTPLEPMRFNTLIAHSKSHPLKMDFVHSLQTSTSLLVPSVARHLSTAALVTTSATMFYSWFLQQVSSYLPKTGFLHCRAFLCCLLRCWISLPEGL